MSYKNIELFQQLEFEISIWRTTFNGKQIFQNKTAIYQFFWLLPFIYLSLPSFYHFRTIPAHRIMTTFVFFARSENGPNNNIITKTVSADKKFRSHFSSFFLLLHSLSLSPCCDNKNYKLKPKDIKKILVNPQINFI